MDIRFDDDIETVLAQRFTGFAIEVRGEQSLVAGGIFTVNAAATTILVPGEALPAFKVWIDYKLSEDRTEFELSDLGLKVSCTADHAMPNYLDLIIPKDHLLFAEEHLRASGENRVTVTLGRENIPTIIETCHSVAGSTGKRCRRKIRPGQQYCYQHRE